MSRALLYLLGHVDGRLKRKICHDLDAVVDEQIMEQANTTHPCIPTTKYLCEYPQ
jgi:hypothetical protein